ncbi:hypothetical protein ACQBAR_01490 [Propionibacteriaceae bacterium Y1685]
MPSRRSVLATTLGGLSGLALAGGLTTAPANATPVDAATRTKLWGWAMDQVDFIESKTVASGAVRSPTDDLITPYFTSWGMMGLAAVNTPKARSILGGFIEWYLAHLNTAEEDTYGFGGTVFVYAYDAETGAETSTNAYSSVDAGVTCPLIMAHDAVRTGDKDLQALVLDNMESWELMATAVVEYEPAGVRAEDDICWSRPRPNNMGYVQDNAVIYLGLKNLAWLERRAGRGKQARFYDEKAEATRSRMLSKLWNAERQNWNWGHGTNLAKLSYPEKAFMPDAWCQYWQTGLKVVQPDSPEAIASWKAYNEGVPRWMYNEIDNNFPHTEMALTAVLMGDTENAITLLETVNTKFGPDWAAPWYVGEAGHYLRTVMAMIGPNRH